MADLADYTESGNLDAPFAVTKQHERRQKQAEDIRDAVTCATAPLSWAEYISGAPCPGCGLPYRDEIPWHFKGTMYFTPGERERYDAEEAAFKERHPNCRAMRHSASGSLTTHCGKCCPPPPMSPTKARELSEMFGRMSEHRRPEDLMRWRLRFFCGHEAEKVCHRSYLTAEQGFGSHSKCPECGLDPATIVDARPIGLEGNGASTGTPARAGTLRPKRRTRDELERRVAELEAELAEAKAPRS